MASSEGIKKWILNEVAHSLRQKDRLSILPALSALTPLFEAHDRARTLGASLTFKDFPNEQHAKE